MDFAIWLLEKPDCKVCRHFNLKKGIDDPCAKNLCERPEILPENEEVIFIWEKVADQLEYSSLGVPVRLDITSLRFVMELYKDQIRNKINCFEKLQILARQTIKYLNEAVKMEKA